MSNLYHTKNGRNSKRGAFLNGVWHCDCDPRLPAEKFQTKNGGKNHGRWFFTCQKPQPKRCSFFLWSDDAKVREEAAVINNSRTEPNLPTEPKTPQKSTATPQPPTPVSRVRSETLSAGSTRKKRWSPDGYDEPEESFGWSSDGDEELMTIADAAGEDIESPRKTARTLSFNSPGKRTYSDVVELNRSEGTRPFSDNVFNTPKTSTGLLSPMDTHQKTYRPDSAPQLDSTLTSEVLHLLKPVKLPMQTESALTELLDRHSLRTQGIIRGRDITRVAVQTKEKKIAELQGRITALEAEKETSRAVIAHLKQDIATSPKRPTRSRLGSRSEI